MLGYLLAGVVIGPLGLRLVSNVEQIATVSELGVVMLLFLIGLELRPQRLWVMRRVRCSGSARRRSRSAPPSSPCWRMSPASAGPAPPSSASAWRSPPPPSCCPCWGSGICWVDAAGRDSFAVLLFQDLAFIPLVALVPLLAPGQGAELLGSVAHHVPWRAVLVAALTVATILVGGRFLVPVVFRLIGGARTPEVFTATALLIVVGTAFLASQAGLSMSLGAFMAGVLLSGSEYRHELQADVEPFEGLLLGFFFMSVGMQAQLGLLLSEPALILGGVAALMLANSVVALGLGRATGQDWANAVRFATALPQGSEFSFVMFAAAVAVGALTQREADHATLVIAVSMAATPLLFAASERLAVPLLTPRRAERYDPIEEHAPVIICGFGRVGQIVGRVLRMQRIPFIALESDPTQIDVLRRFGTKVYFGNPSRPDLLRSAGADTAKLLIVALDDVEEGLRVVDIARRTFPKLRILSRARNRRHVHLLMDRGVAGIVRETFHSSLHLTEMTLTALGIPAAEASRTVELFRAFDEKTLWKAMPITKTSGD